jgi:hypothetical protein
MFSKNLPLVALTAIMFSMLTMSCDDNTCKDAYALNLNVDADCQYSKAAFYATSSAYYDAFFNVYDVTKIELFVNGQSFGEIQKYGLPNNCSTPGNLNYQFTSAGAVDWSSVVTLENGNTITYSGTAEPSPQNTCLTIKID